MLYINLEADRARRHWMEAQLERLRRGNPGLEFRAERVAAVDARRAQQDEAFSSSRAKGFSAIAYPNVTGSWGAAACLLSHQEALRRLKDAAREGEVWLVLEDDAELPGDLFQEWERLWGFLPEDWDVARLGWFGSESCEGRVNAYVDLALWSDPPPGGPCSYCGSQAYALNPKSAAKVLRRLETAKIMHVDCLLGARTPPGEDPALLPEIRSYAFRPAPVLQNEDFPSDRE